MKLKGIARRAERKIRKMETIGTYTVHVWGGDLHISGTWGGSSWENVIPNPRYKNGKKVKKTKEIIKLALFNEEHFRLVKKEREGR